MQARQTAMPLQLVIGLSQRFFSKSGQVFGQPTDAGESSPVRSPPHTLSSPPHALLIAPTSLSVAFVKASFAFWSGQLPVPLFTTPSLHFWKALFFACRNCDDALAIVRWHLTVVA